MSKYFIDHMARYQDGLGTISSNNGTSSSKSWAAEVASAAGGIIGSLLGSSATNKSIAASKEINASNQEFQRQMTQEEREYNTPSAQYQRLIEAGINPNVAAASVAGNGANDSTMAASPTSAMPDTSGLAQSGSILSQTGANIATLLQQQDLIKSQTNLNNTNAGKSAAETETENVLREFQKRALAEQVNQSKAMQDQIEMTCHKLIADTEYTRMLTSINQTQRGILQETAPIMVAMSHAQLQQCVAQIECLKAQKDATEEQQNYLKAAQKQIDSIIALNKKQEGYIEAQTNYTNGALTNKTNAEANLANEQAETQETQQDLNKSQTTGNNIQNEINEDTKTARKWQVRFDTANSCVNLLQQGYNLGSEVFSDVLTRGGSAIIRGSQGHGGDATVLKNYVMNGGHYFK